MEFPSSCRVPEARPQVRLGPHHEQSQQVALYSEKSNQRTVTPTSLENFYSCFLKKKSLEASINNNNTTLWYWVQLFELSIYKMKLKGMERKTKRNIPSNKPLFLLHQRVS
ncbi:hypothetical protein V8G54_028219 [Vigna mungo]|uniref:Uncharacterized protein n=1 Tax=Vigna mungo TaxID=3915 RepID=A0AAQ3MSD2_VIGMU